MLHIALLLGLTELPQDKSTFAAVYYDYFRLPIVCTYLVAVRSGPSFVVSANRNTMTFAGWLLG